MKSFEEWTKEIAERGNKSAPQEVEEVKSNRPPTPRECLTKVLNDAYEEDRRRQEISADLDVLPIAFFRTESDEDIFWCSETQEWMYPCCKCAENAPIYCELNEFDPSSHYCGFVRCEGAYRNDPQT